MLSVMRMNLSDLLKGDKIKKIEPDPEQAKECLAASERDLKLAKKMLSADLDWSFAIAYNSMLQATRALMFTDGYSPIGESYHIIAIDYAKIKFESKFREIILLFSDMRKKRNEAVYWEVGIISEHEAKYAIECAEKFLKIVREKLGV